MKTILKKALLRAKEDNPKQFFSRVALYIISAFLKIKVCFFMIFFKKKNTKRWVIKEINQNKMFLDIKDKGISKELLYKGIREPRCTEFIKKFIKQGEICIDIGANIGYYALLEAKLVGTKGKVYAIEPVQSNFELLEKNIKINDYDNIETYRLAIGPKNKIGFINLSDSSNLHSFLKEGESNSRTEKIKIITLDDFLKDKPYPQFVRMDVEGYENEIIKGMKKILEAKKPFKMFIELHSFMIEDGGEELLKALEKAGFIIKALFNERHALMTGENKLISFFYDFFKKGIGILNNSLENYDIPINDFLNDIDRLKRNSFSLFLERK